MTKKKQQQQQSSDRQITFRATANWEPQEVTLDAIRAAAAARNLALLANGDGSRYWLVPNDRTAATPVPFGSRTGKRLEDIADELGLLDRKIWLIEEGDNGWENEASYWADALLIGCTDESGQYWSFTDESFDEDLHEHSARIPLPRCERGQALEIAGTVLRAWERQAGIEDTSGAHRWWLDDPADALNTAFASLEWAGNVRRGRRHRALGEKLLSLALTGQGSSASSLLTGAQSLCFDNQYVLYTYKKFMGVVDLEDERVAAIGETSQPVEVGLVRLARALGATPPPPQV